MYGTYDPHAGRKRLIEVAERITAGMSDEEKRVVGVAWRRLHEMGLNPVSLEAKLRWERSYSELIEEDAPFLKAAGEP